MTDNNAYHHTHKADSSAKSRQWNHVVESVQSRGGSRVSAIIQANGVVKNHPAGSGEHAGRQGVGQDHG